MAVNGVSVWFWDGKDTPAQDVRLGTAALLRNGTTRPVGTRNGSRPGSAPTTVSGSTGTIPPRSVVIDPAATNTQGPYLVAWNVAQTVTFDPAPSSGSRIDVVYARVFDDIFDASGQQAVTFGVVRGNASANPSAPTVLADGITPLSKVCVLDYVTWPSSGAPTVLPGPVVVAAGGVAPVKSSDRGVLHDGQVVTDTDTRTMRVNWLSGGLVKVLTERDQLIDSDNLRYVVQPNGIITVPFNKVFAAPPNVTCVLSDPDASPGYPVPGSTNSAVSFPLIAYRPDGTRYASGDGVRVRWVAVGTAP